MKRLLIIALTASTLCAVEEPLHAFPDLQPPAVYPTPRKNPMIAVGLSTLFPGLGHVYLGETQTAGALIGGAGAAIGLAALSDNKSFFASSYTSVWAISWYGIYASLRDVRRINGGSYSYQMPKDDFVDLAFASFKPSILKKPEVWGGFIGAMTLGITVSYFAFPDKAHVKLTASSANLSYFPPTAFGVGIAEESLFRGVLQSQLSEMFNPTAGIVLSSLIFGAAHIPNAAMMEHDARRRYYAISLPMITAFGAYFGWLANKNHSLQECVALHSWYDFTLFAIDAFADQSLSTGKASFALAIPF